MEKYKTIILIEKIRKCLEEGKPQEALTIAESIDKKKLKNMSDLSVVAESYFQNVKYEEAKQLYIRIYQKTPSRRIVAQLVHLSIKLNDLEEANHYLKEFIHIAPKDFYQYIFRYSIDKMSKAPLVKLIEDLQDLKNAEYIESWAYELAKLYHKAGLKDECVAECDEIVLWFGSGEYVERANALRAYYRGEILIDESEIMTKSDEIEKTAENQKTASHEEEMEEGTETERDEVLVNNVEENSEENVEENLEEDSEENSEENMEENSEENSEVNSEENPEENMEENVEENSEENVEVNSEEYPEENMEENSKENMEINLAENMKEIKEENTEDPIEDVLENQVKDELVEQVEGDIKDQMEGKSGEQIQADSEQNTNSFPMDHQDFFKSFNDNDKFEEDDFLNLESALADQLELTFQEREKLSDKEDEPKSDVELNQNKDEELSQETDEKVNQASSSEERKVNLNVLTNEQLVGEEEEDLRMQLTRNQVSLFDIYGNFIRMELVRKQLVRSMDQILTQRLKNVILTGESQSGKTRLAKCYAKWLHRMKLIQSTKIALIDGEKINHMNLLAKKEQLKDCVIIIENAGMVTKETMKSLLELSNLYENNIAIILEDNREKMNDLLRGNSQLNSIFNNRIHLHKYTLEDYMGFAYDYITERDYEIEMEAYIALQNEFSIFMQKKRENVLTAIFSYLDYIIQKSEKRSTQQLKELSQSGRFEDSELMVVKLEDLKS